MKNYLVIGASSGIGEELASILHREGHQVYDIAEMAAFLLSDKAGWITGQVYGVDGGMSSLKVS